MRLTHKHKYKKDSQRFVFDMKDYRKACQKLGQLEDIEEELGIDLITLFQALKNGVYYFTNGNQLTKDCVWLLDNYISVGTREKLSYSFMTAFERQTLSFQDYGKTWALTKEELLCTNVVNLINL